MTRQDKEARLEQHEKLRIIMGWRSLGVTLDELPHTFVMYDHLRSAAGSEATRLLKLRSEERFCDVIAAGFIILSFVDIFYLMISYSADRFALLVILIAVALTCYLRGRRTQRYFSRGMCTVWLSTLMRDLTTAVAESDEKDTEV